MAEMYIIEVPANSSCDTRYHLETTERDARRFVEQFVHFHPECAEPKIMTGGFGLLSMLLRAQTETA